MQEEGEAEKAINNSVCPTFVFSGSSIISELMGTSNNLWFGIYLFLTTIGFLILVSLSNIFYVNPDAISSGWYQGLLFVVCMIASVCIFGGFVVALWRFWERKSSKECGEDGERSDIITTQKHFYEYFVNSTTIQYGSRPNFKGMHH